MRLAGLSLSAICLIALVGCASTSAPNGYKPQSALELRAFEIGVEHQMIERCAADIPASTVNGYRFAANTWLASLPPSQRAGAQSSFWAGARHQLPVIGKMHCGDIAKEAPSRVSCVTEEARDLLKSQTNIE